LYPSHPTKPQKKQKKTHQKPAPYTLPKETIPTSKRAIRDAAKADQLKAQQALDCQKSILHTPLVNTNNNKNNKTPVSSSSRPPILTSADVVKILQT
jgi:hypothetical protein